MRAVLGFDTSCYTTSVAAVSWTGEILTSRRRLLRVPLGERGLQQSEGLFQHVTALPFTHVKRIYSVIHSFSFLLFLFSNFNSID